VTGNQGGAVAQALQGTGFYLRGLTRKPDTERAAAAGAPSGSPPTARLPRNLRAGACLTCRSATALPRKAGSATM
jgi:hypothetical protein